MAEFNDEEELPKPICKNGCFEIPWDGLDGMPIQRPSTVKFCYSIYMEKSRPDVPSSKELDSIEEMQILPVEKETLRNPPLNSIQATWIGHAGFLVQLGGMNILFDPVFSDKIGPVAFMHVGTKRYRKCPLKIDELPNIDIVCVSHDHYDHCDWPTIQTLHKNFKDIQWCVPLGIDKWLKKHLGDEIKNFDFTWWQSRNVNAESHDSFVEVICVPAQHWCVRGMKFGKISDENTRLWSGWIVKAPDSNLSVYHTGDTGYCEVFKTIGQKYGPIDMAMIPIGAYCPRETTTFQHVNPEEAVKVHQDIKAKQSIAMHWGTFSLTLEHFLEPPKLLQQAMNDASLPSDQFLVLKHGQTVTFP